MFGFQIKYEKNAFLSEVKLNHRGLAKKQWLLDPLGSQGIRDIVREGLQKKNGKLSTFCG